MSPHADRIRSRRVSSHVDAIHLRRRPTVLVPWLVYVGVTLVGPAANGAWRSPGFAEHAWITLAVSGAIAGVWAAAVHRSRSKKGSRPGS